MEKISWERIITPIVDVEELINLLQCLRACDVQKREAHLRERSEIFRYDYEYFCNILLICKVIFEKQKKMIL